MTQRALTLPAYDYANTCPACGGTTSTTAFHARPRMDRPGTWPCGAYRPGQLGAHHCRRCDNCGHRWMEGLIPA
jgi:hypothetical protein